MKAPKLQLDWGDAVGIVSLASVFEGVRGIFGIHAALLVIGATVFALYALGVLRRAFPGKGK